jgi:hypothetical protein
VYNILTARKGSQVVVYSDGNIIASYDMNVNKEYDITNEYGTNTIKVSNGKVSISEASCSNQVCVHHTAIKNSNESIICLPNHLVVKINTNTKRRKVDDIAK